MKKILFLLFIAGVVLASAYFIYPFALRAVFSVSGTAEIIPGFAGRAGKPNTMLFLVAKNEGGVPVAVKKIINPAFPQNFQMNPADLILPDVLTKSLYLEAFLNNHGELGVFRSGDMKGSAKGPFLIFSKKIRIRIDTSAK